MPTNSRIATLDILRFLAAVCVVTYHYIARPEAEAFQFLAPVAQFGYLGVPVFFIISGYVISLSAENRTAYEFAVSRLVRLYPALWFGVVFTSIVLFLSEIKPIDLTQIFANMTLLNDYFGIPNIDGVYWTLQAELKFYGCVFVLLTLGIFPHYKAWLSVWLALTIAHLFYGQPTIMGWFISPSYSSFFISGVAFYLIQKKGFTLYSSVVLLVSAGLCVYQANRQALGFIKDISSDEQLVASLIILASMLIFVLISRGWLSLSSSKLTYTLGALTYPLYLLHNSAGKIIIDYGISANLSEGMLILIVIALMLFLSYFVFRFVEKPLARLIRSLLLPQIVSERGRLGQ